MSNAKNCASVLFGFVLAIVLGCRPQTAPAPSSDRVTDVDEKPASESVVAHQATIDKLRARISQLEQPQARTALQTETDDTQPEAEYPDYSTGEAETGLAELREPPRQRADEQHDPRYRMMLCREALGEANTRLTRDAAREYRLAIREIKARQAALEDLVLRLLADPDPRIRERGVAAVYEYDLQDEMFTQRLIELSKDDCSAVRQTASEVLRMVDSTAAQQAGIELAPPPRWPSDVQRSAAEEKTDRALAAMTSFQFEETPLDRVLVYLSNRHEVNIEIAKGEGIFPFAPITLSLRDITLDAALTLLLASFDDDLTFLSTADGIIITNRTSKLAAPVTRVYDVEDLLLGGATAEQLAALIRTHESLARDSDDERPLHIDAKEQSLLVKARPAVQQRVAELLAAIGTAANDEASQSLVDLPKRKAVRSRFAARFDPFQPVADPEVRPAPRRPMRGDGDPFGGDPFSGDAGAASDPFAHPASDQDNE